MKFLLAPLVVLFTVLTGCAGSKNAPSREHVRSAMLGTNCVHYVVVGRGPAAIVFVHRWALNGEVRREQLPALADQARQMT